MSRPFMGGKRDREAARDRRKKEKQARLDYNRSQRARNPGAAGGDVTEMERLPEVKLEDIVIGVVQQPRRNTTGPVRLFVGGLSWGTSSDDLRNAFAKYGAVDEATVIMDRATGRSRGFGFVTFQRAEDAAASVKEMNGAQLDGRILKVHNAESR